MFTILRQVMARSTRKSQDDESLRDEVLRDTLGHIMNQAHESSLGKVMENVWSYVDLIHHQNYSADLLQCELPTVHNVPVADISTSHWEGSFNNPKERKRAVCRCL